MYIKPLVLFMIKSKLLCAYKSRGCHASNGPFGKKMVERVEWFMFKSITEQMVLNEGLL